MIGEHVRPTLDTLAARFGVDCTIEPLAGDVSTRIYYRLSRRFSTSILVDTGRPIQPAEDPFLAAARLLGDAGLPVPRVLAVFPDEGLMILEDLGELLLQRHLADAPEARRDSLYELAVDHLIRLHTQGSLLLARCAGHPAGQQALDRERFLFEFDFFREHYLQGLRGAAPSGADAAELTRFFEDLAAEVAGFGRVLAHRDYHARNLMWHSGRLFLIDFQDARWGPVTYDLASLLRDSYVALPEASVERLLERFRAGMLARLRDLSGDPAGASAEDVGRLAESVLPTLRSAEQFRRRFDLTCLQRNIKALGTFGYMATARANPLYVRYVAPTARHIRQNLSRFPEFAKPAAILDAVGALPS